MIYTRTFLWGGQVHVAADADDDDVLGISPIQKIISCNTHNVMEQIYQRMLEINWIL